MFNGMNGLEILNSWPRYESGEPVGFGDKYVNAKGNVSTLRTIVITDCRDRLGGGYYWKLGKGDCAVMVKNGERIKRPPVLAADREPLEVGQTVWHEETGRGPWVVVRASNGQATVDEKENVTGTYDGNMLTHQRPVLDADGVPIELGDDLYSVEGSLKLHVSNIDRANYRIATSAMFALDKWADPSMFTHTKPEPSDSWAKWRKDFIKRPCVYCRDILGVDFDNYKELDKAFDAQAHDMERRAKALDGMSE